MTCAKPLSALLVLFALAGCSDTRAGTTMNTTYLDQLATSADQIVALAKTDEPAARTQARHLMDKMCAYVAGLENAGLNQEQVQQHLDTVGERLGAAFVFAGQ